MKKIFAVLLCAVLLLSCISVLCFAYRDDPSVEAVVENTIGKYIPVGEALSNGYFQVVNTIKDYLENTRDFLADMLTRVQSAFGSLDWVPGWMR